MQAYKVQQGESCHTCAIVPGEVTSLLPSTPVSAQQSQQYVKHVLCASDVGCIGKYWLNRSIPCSVHQCHVSLGASTVSLHSLQDAP